LRDFVLRLSLLVSEPFSLLYLGFSLFVPPFVSFRREVGANKASFLFLVFVKIVTSIGDTSLFVNDDDDDNDNDDDDDDDDDDSVSAI